LKSAIDKRIVREFLIVLPGIGLAPWSALEQAFMLCPDTGSLAVVERGAREEAA
jgi:hypothetical protein